MSGSSNLEKTDWASAAAQSTSSLGRRLHKDVLGQCFQFAGVAGVASVGLAAKHLHVESETGAFWKWAVQAEFPHAEAVAGAKGWKCAYKFALQEHRRVQQEQRIIAAEQESRETDEREWDAFSADPHQRISHRLRQSYLFTLPC